MEHQTIGKWYVVSVDVRGRPWRMEYIVNGKVLARMFGEGGTWRADVAVRYIGTPGPFQDVRRRAEAYMTDILLAGRAASFEIPLPSCVHHTYTQEELEHPDAPLPVPEAGVSDAVSRLRRRVEQAATAMADFERAMARPSADVQPPPAVRSGRRRR